MTGAGAAALAFAWGWLSATVLRPARSPWSLVAVVVASAAVAAEAFVIGGAAPGLVAVAGIAGGAAAQRLWLRAVRASTPRERRT